MEKQLTKMFRILLISNDVLTVNGKVSDLYFFRKIWFSSQYCLLPDPTTPKKRARWGQRRRGQNQNHTLRKRTGCKVEFPSQSYCLLILQPQQITSSPEASAFSWFACWNAVVCPLHMPRLVWHMLSKLDTRLLLAY